MPLCTEFVRTVRHWGLLGLFSISVGGAWSTANAAIHVISPSTSSVDCSTYGGGVRPGDTIILDGTSRGPITLTKCTGTAVSPIVVRNDTTEAGPLIIRQSGSGFKSKCNDCTYVVFDGTGKWAGAPAGTCGVDLTGGNWTLGTSQCGIVFRCESGDPQSGLRFGRSSRNITVKGVEVDGNFPTCTWGIGIDVNDHEYKLADHQGEWREGYVFKNNYIHSTARSGIYFGPNQDDDGAGDLQVRNNEIAYNYVHKTGCDGIKYKSVLEGQSSIHHNYVADTGQSTAGSSDGCASNGIILYEAGYTEVYSNYVESPSPKSGGQGNCILQYTQDMASTKVARLPASIYNNTVHNCKGAGIAVGRKDSSVSAPVPTIFFNTVVAPVGTTGIVVNSSIGSCSVRDNLVAGTSISASQCAPINNRTGTVESQKFRDPSRRDFRLTESSPARNAGETQCPSWDQVRTPRPIDGACDQGALEYVAVDAIAIPRPPEPLVVD